MTRKLIATTILATLFASASFAQMSDDPGPSPTESMTPDWNETITDTFFEDQSASLLRSDQEIEERWQSLSEDDQAQIRDDCANMIADATGGVEGAPMDTEPPTTAETDPLEPGPLDSESAADGTVDSETTTGSTDLEGDAGLQSASIQQICATVDSL